MNLYAPCEGLVLAGGQSTRMHGQNKALLLLDGEPMLAHVLAQLAPFCITTRIGAGQHKTHYQAAFNHHPIVEDSGVDGPLAGVLAGLKALTATCDWLVCSPCDTPKAGGDWVKALLTAQLATPNYRAFYIEHQGSPHYAHSLWHKTLIPALEDALAQSQRSLKGCLGQVNAQVVTLPTRYEGNLANVNTPQALAKICRRLASDE